MTDTVRILKAARDLIAKPENWTQGAYARDNFGRDVVETSCFAKCFCAYGAVWKASSDVPSRAPHAIDALRSVVENGELAGFNDTHTHAEVLDLFSKAIAAEEGK